MDRGLSTRCAGSATACDNRGPEISLKTRLLLALLALTAVGLVILAAVSYAALRSYLADRVDQQVESAVGPVARALFAKAAGATAPSVDDGAAAPPGFDPPEGGPPGAQLPPGTYGELRQGGEVISRLTFSYGEADTPRPELPTDLSVASAPSEVAPTTVDGSDGTDFRAVAISTPEGAGSIVVAVPLTELERTLDRLLLIEIVVTGGVLGTLALVGLWVVRVGLRPLERMEATAREIAAGDLSRRVEPTNERTEVGRLGIAFNEMLGQIERAFAEREASEERLRRFLADASHELRTPLSSIRGYAELFRLGMVQSPQDQAKAMGRIESEAERMGALVEDLLRLARLDEVSEPSREMVDLTALVREIGDDARAAAPDRPIELELAAAEVTGDEARLRQVVSNLVFNALRHTPARTAIEISLAADEEVVELEVRDHGPGLPEGVEDDVFERHWRRRSADIDQDGGGLGLAIVRAIVATHDGKVSAANAREGGAVFTVTLPRSPRSVADRTASA